jgi:hypothetical protein
MQNCREVANRIASDGLEYAEWPMRLLTRLAMADVHALASNTESPRVPGSVEITTAPRTSAWIKLRGDGQDPMDPLEIPEEVKLCLECGESRPGVRLRRERIQLALSAHPDRGHLSDRRVEGARLASSRITRVVDAPSTI